MWTENSTIHRIYVDVDSHNEGMDWVVLASAIPPESVQFLFFRGEDVEKGRQDYRLRSQDHPPKYQGFA